MYLENFRASLPPSDRGWLGAIQAYFSEQAERGGFYPLRFAIAGFEAGCAQLETTAVRFEDGEPHAAPFGEIEILAPRILPRRAGPFAVVQVIPTGIGCVIGGFAGDACPATNLLASAADFVVTHPNAVNASELNEMEGNVLYVEGKLLDDFLLGHIALEPARGKNRVGTVVDYSADEYVDAVVKTLNAATASAGLDCNIWIRTSGAIGAQVSWSAAGCATGVVGRPDLLIEAVEQLVAAGCDAVGVSSVIHGVTRAAFLDHQKTGRPNPSGGVEAIITHLISKIFRVPSAHAPLPYYTEHKRDCPIDPRSSAEFISTPHYFSVLKGLARAPRPAPIPAGGTASATGLSMADVGAVGVPASALGGVPALAAELNSIPIIAVTDNHTILAVDREAMKLGCVIEAKSYAEAAGLILALRHGISLRSLGRPLTTASEIRRPLEFARDRSRKGEPEHEPAKSAWDRLRKSSS
jgi:hypothetical protein